MIRRRVRGFPIEQPTTSYKRDASVSGSGHSTDQVTSGSEGRARTNSFVIRQQLHQSTDSWSPAFWTAFKLLLATRLFSAFFHPQIYDCDETFNYWEPMHYLQYGYGLQTWEYSPVNAIRSWAYIAMHALIAEPFRIWFGNSGKWMVFMGLRCILAAACAVSEAYLFRAVAEHLSAKIGRYLLLILIFAPGMYISSTAFLPSSFAMITTCLAAAHMISRTCLTKQPSSNGIFPPAIWPIFWIGLGSLVGWPFSAAIGIPFVFEEVVFRAVFMKQSTNDLQTTLLKLSQSFTNVLRAVFVSAFIILIPLLSIDRLFYREWKLVPWNIVAYNVFNTRSSAGPDIYGTEPWSFYFLNGFLNFNFAFIAALSSLPLLFLLYSFSFETIVACVNVKFLASSFGRPYHYLAIKIIPFYWWLLIFTAQAHKEERFLFVAYPYLALSAATSVSLISAFFTRLAIKARVKRNRVNSILSRVLEKLPTTFSGGFLLVFAIISVSRIVALGIHYGASFEVYRQFLIDNPQAKGNICVGREWFRFPSHYHLPHHIRLQFIQTGPQGQLPKYFLQNDKDIQFPSPLSLSSWLTERPGTWASVGGFNTENREEPDRYVQLDQCDYLIKFFTSDMDSEFPLQFANKSSSGWNKIICRPYLDAKQTKSFQRAFWIPSFLEQQLIRRFSFESKKWGDYCILRR